MEKGTRNVEVEATLPNPDLKLLPGMFATVNLKRDIEEKYITLPVAAITYNPYGNLVYGVTQTGEDKKGNPVYTVKQKFVKVGDTRGDQVAVISGINEGEEIVTSGQLKLKNGSLVAINNSVLPDEGADPKVTNEHNGDNRAS